MSALQEIHLNVTRLMMTTWMTSPTTNTLLLMAALQAQNDLIEHLTTYLMAMNSPIHNHSPSLSQTCRLQQEAGAHHRRRQHPSSTEEEGSSDEEE